MSLAAPLHGLEYLQKLLIVNAENRKAMQLKAEATIMPGKAVLPAIPSIVQIAKEIRLM